MFCFYPVCSIDLSKLSNFRGFRDFGLATCWLVDLLACGLFLGFSLRNLGFSLRKLKKNTNSLEL